MLRSEIFSECEAANEYTEKLIRTEGYIGYFDYSRYSFEPKTRDYFLLPPDRFLVGCLQTTHKIHPDFDLYLEQIAQIDESILIVMSPSADDRSMERFIRRLKRSAPTAYRQLCIVARTSIQDFFALNNLLDLNLDTIYYGAGVTFVQTAWCGPPYITQRSGLVRSSVVSASYSYAGIVNPPIADSMNDYIDLVQKYYFDRDGCAALRSEVQAKMRESIYNDERYIRSCEQVLESFL
jgi:predicted O-linked N-acetylglucosamine transferase (SPINDLY family)